MGMRTLSGRVFRAGFNRQIIAGNISARTHDDYALTDNSARDLAVQNEISVIHDISIYLAGNYGISPGLNDQSAEQFS